MSARRFAVVALFAIAGCSKPGTFALVDISGSPSLQATSIDLQLQVGTRTMSHTLREAGGGAVQLPTSVGVQFDETPGLLAITAVARDAKGAPLAQGSGSGTLVHGTTIDIPLVLGVAGDDLSVGSDASVGDLAQSGDLSGADLASIPDLTSPPDLTSVVVCGAGQKACGATCIATSACCVDSDCPATTRTSVTSCVQNSCKILSCTAGYADCDAAYANGCEVYTNGDIKNCGACGRVCSTFQSTSQTCATGECYATCQYSNEGDCNHPQAPTPDDGCEADLDQSPNCGKCGVVCSGGLSYCCPNLDASQPCVDNESTCEG